MRCEDHLLATPTDGLRFGCMEECLSQTMASMVLADPEVRDLSAASPSVATETCDDFASSIPNACPQKPSVKVARRFGVELVDTLHEERIQLLALDLVEQHKSFGLPYPRQFSVTHEPQRQRSAPGRTAEQAQLRQWRPLEAKPPADESAQSRPSTYPACECHAQY